MTFFDAPTKRASFGLRQEKLSLSRNIILTLDVTLDHPVPIRIAHASAQIRFLDPRNVPLALCLAILVNPDERVITA